MTSIAITIIILLAVAASFTAIQTIYQREAQLKTSVESGRVATAYIERVTRLIGYGIDPKFAIDVGGGNLTPVNQKSNVITAATASAPSYITDDFAFRYRDPSYLRRGNFDQATMKVTIDNTATANGGPASFGINLLTGRLIQIVCAGGQFWTVVKTTGAPIVPGDVQVGVASAIIAGNDTSFRDPPTATVAPCMKFTGDRAPFIMLVREVRLRIMPEGTGVNARPFLVAYNSIEAGNSGTDYDPIAADVESFQVSYMMNKDPAGVAAVPDRATTGDWVMGNEVADTANVPTASATDPSYDTPYADPARFTANVGNVRGVVFEISTRSFRQEKRSAFPQPRLADDARAAAAADGYFRVVVSTTIRTPNLSSRSGFTPPLRVVGNPFQLNEWGG